MNNITYLFGAGASKDALPIVDEIPGRISGLIQEIKGSTKYELSETEFFDNLKLENPVSKKDLLAEMIGDLQWLLESSSNHASVDTLAKKFYIKRQYAKLDRLKIALSVFFVLEQARRPVDRRYDTFFASILTSVSKLPENISLLSWNYDYQFELAFSEYSDNKEITRNQDWLNVKKKSVRNDKTEGFGIYKLNGTTGLADSRPFGDYVYANVLKDAFSKELIEEVTRNYAAATRFNNLYPTLSFAWEGEEKEDGVIQLATKAINNTDVLVVIGYSFRFFNREIDKKLIVEMPSLKKVYFQSPDPHNLSATFAALIGERKVELVERLNYKQFLLPNEL